MSKGFVFSILLFVGAFVSLNWVLTRPTHESAAAPVVAQSETHDEKTEVIREMAKFVEKNPAGFKPQVAGIAVGNPQAKTAPTEERVPVVLGIQLNQNSKEKLWTPEGQAQLRSSIGPNTTIALQDVKQAFFSIDANHFDERETLLEVTNTLAKDARDPMAKNMLFNEASQYLVQSEHQNQDYGSRALQYYLDHESDADGLKSNLEKIGIPVIHVDSPRAPASEAAQNP